MKNREFLKIFIGIQILFILLALVLYRSFGRQLIEAMYYQRSLPFLGSVIKGQAYYPVLFYQILADKLFLKCFLFGVGFILLEFVILGMVNKPSDGKYQNQTSIGRDKAARKPAKAAIKAGLVIVTVALAATFYLLRYKSLLQSLRYYDKVSALTYKERIFPKLENSQVAMLGTAHEESNRPKSSYAAFSESKKPGIIRIGIFGCSHVQGVEIAAGYDFPSLLQDKFKRAGVDNVEVINFGVGSYGMFQSYLLWEYLGKRYHLDYVVWMPFSWHRWRDNTFVDEHFDYGPVHARYIIKGHGVELIPVVGTTRAQACKIYYRIIPPWRYIRHEDKMPLFLRTLLPSGLHRRSNPFYYKLGKSKQREIFTIYGRLFDRLSEQVDALIIITKDDEVYNLREEVSSSNIYFIRDQAPKLAKSFLYLTSKDHPSAMYNQIRADQLFSLFRGEEKPEFKTIQVSSDLECGEGDSASLPSPLYQYADISVNIGQRPVGGFVTNLSGPHRGRGCGEYLDFEKLKIASLLMMPTADTGSIRFAYLPNLRKDKEPIYLSFKIGDNSVKVPIGVVDASAVVLGRFSVKLNQQDYFVKGGSNWRLEVKRGGIFLQADSRIKEIYIMVGDRRILKPVALYENTILNSISKFVLGRISVLSFEPILSDFGYLRAKPGQFIDVDTLDKKEGYLDLVLVDKDGRQQRYPIFSYKLNRRIETQETEWVNPIRNAISNGVES